MCTTNYNTEKELPEQTSLFSNCRLSDIIPNFEKSISRGTVSDSFLTKDIAYILKNIGSSYLTKISLYENWGMCFDNIIREIKEDIPTILENEKPFVESGVLLVMLQLFEKEEENEKLIETMESLNFKDISRFIGYEARQCFISIEDNPLNIGNKVFEEIEKSINKRR